MMHSKSFAIMIGWLLMSSMFASALANDARMRSTNEIHELISGWQTEKARNKLLPLLKEAPNDPGVRLAEGRLLYFEGEYGEAKKQLQSLSDDLAPNVPGSITDQLKQASKTYEALKDFNEKRSEDGRFLVKYTGRDAVLVPTVIEVLVE